MMIELWQNILQKVLMSVQLVILMPDKPTVPIVLKNA